MIFLLISFLTLPIFYCILYAKVCVWEVYDEC
jgi:hypothetical protein